MRNPNRVYTDRLKKARKIVSRVRIIAIQTFSDPVADDLTDALHLIDNAIEKLRIGKITDAAQQEDKRICLHCRGKIAIRNPKGFCDHLFYPDNCRICSARENKAVGKVKVKRVGGYDPNKKRRVRFKLDVGNADY
jgi:hypothetical protein